MHKMLGILPHPLQQVLQMCTIEHMNQRLQLVIEPADTLGGRVVQARRALGLSQTQLGDMIDKSKGAIGNWEGGQAIPSDQLILIARALHRPIEWFVQGLDGYNGSDPDGGEPVEPSVTRGYPRLRRVA